MIRDAISPALRSMGFKGSSGRYELPHPDFWILLGFQKSKANSETYVKFTINIAVVRKSDWEEASLSRPLVPSRPDYSINWGVFGMPGLYGRVGQFMRRGDLWWKIEYGRRRQTIAREIIQAVRDDVLPAIESAIT